MREFYGYSLCSLYIYGMNRITKYGTTALVAGASEGIGAAFATYLAHHGIHLVLIARRKEPLDTLARELIEKFSVRVETIPCDLSQPQTDQYLMDQLSEKSIDIFIYNAGLSYIGAFEKNTMEHHQEIVHTNVVTPISLIQSTVQACGLQCRVEVLGGQHKGGGNH